MYRTGPTSRLWVRARKYFCTAGRVSEHTRSWSLLLTLMHETSTSLTTVAKLTWNSTIITNVLPKSGRRVWAADGVLSVWRNRSTSNRSVAFPDALSSTVVWSVTSKPRVCSGYFFNVVDNAVGRVYCTCGDKMTRVTGRTYKFSLPTGVKMNCRQPVHTAASSPSKIPLSKSASHVNLRRRYATMLRLAADQLGGTVPESAEVVGSCYPAAALVLDRPGRHSPPSVMWRTSVIAGARAAIRRSSTRSARAD